MTIVITSDFSAETLEYQDKTSQCNLESEIGKNFLMFDDEDMYFSVLVPRRKLDGKVYVIEDVNSRSYFISSSGDFYLHAHQTPFCQR